MRTNFLLVLWLSSCACGIAFSPDGKFLAAGEKGNTIIFDVERGRLKQVLSGGFETVRAVAWAPDEETLASGGDDGKRLATGSFRRLCVRKPETGKLLNTIAGRCGDFSPDGRTVALLDASIIRLHDLNDGRLFRSLLLMRDGQWAVVSPDGHWRGSQRAAREFVYVAHTNMRQGMFTSQEFLGKYGWKNNPDRVFR